MSNDEHWTDSERASAADKREAVEEIGEPRLTRNTNDSVFCDLFSRKEYLLDLYRDLHPEDTATQESDLEIVTIERVITNGQYNDVGFVVSDRLVVLIESQTEWSINIVTRMLLYVSETIRQILFMQGRSLHDTAPIPLPTPELYMIYTGDRDVPDELRFTRDVPGADKGSLEIVIHVLRGSDGIVGQYVEFTRLADEVKADEGLDAHEKAAELVQRCIDNGILSEYMRQRQREVRGIMFTLFDQERETRLYHERLAKKATEEGHERGLEQGLEQGLDIAIDSMTAKLQECGVDEALLQEATNIAREKLAAEQAANKAAAEKPADDETATDDIADN